MNILQSASPLFVSAVASLIIAISTLLRVKKGAIRKFVLEAKGRAKTVIDGIYLRGYIAEEIVKWQ